MHFNTNIKLLRKRKGRTQDDVAFALGMKRSTLSGYENLIAQPGIDTLIAFSKYFNVAIDTLIKVDLAALSESQLNQLERGYDVYIRGSNLRVLTTTIDSQNNENIELVGEKAKAGYTNGFADPEYIKVLPAFHLPFLSRNKKYRSFQISGDSMLPIPDGSYVTGEYVVDWNFIRSHQPYIILTREEGVVFKIAENKLKEEGKLALHSLNPLYEPYELHVDEIREVWKFVHYISSEMPEPNRERDQLSETVKQLQKNVQAIQMRLNL
ncbi:MAG: helix-turn-helix domain-containing protein [Bacteroidetes bacterium]|nr:helix-turn-helix domain-containing protein [Bacteroidales bacterium]MBU1009843.1 helix-turn-helix domain-containing protein [Bacteroidota bacterium]